MKKYFVILFFVSVTVFGQNFQTKLSNAAINLTKDKVVYDPTYFSIKYPNGDVPADGTRYLISHNIGTGQVLQDCLFDWTITGHYFYQ
ncbi:hypothetical protein [Epilithonimonas sp.]|uniref:hypothetical protein n=1 Tax=Epilithonimonas sp. TaxID=2894511 RepID=UPI002899149B|nr:hypothetical protein [Epilithonimonas sp.]